MLFSVYVLYFSNKVNVLTLMGYFFFFISSICILLTTGSNKKNTAMLKKTPQELTLYICLKPRTCRKNKG